MAENQIIIIPILFDKTKEKTLKTAKEISKQLSKFNPLVDAVQLLQDFGFFQVVLPLIIIYAIFYGVLLRTQLFGDPTNNQQPWVKPTSAIVSFAAAFFVVSSTEVVNSLNRLIPQSAFILVAAVLLLMLLVLFGVINPADKILAPGKGTSAVRWIVGITIGIIFLGVIDVSLGVQIPIIHELVLALTGFTPGGQPLGQEALGTLVGLMLVIGIPIALIWWMTKPGAGGSGGGGTV